MTEEEIPEVPIIYDERVGCVVTCPHCLTLRVFMNTLPDTIEECPKCSQKMKPRFRE